MQTPFLLITSFLLFGPGLLAGVLQDGPSDFCVGKYPGNHPDPDRCSSFIMCDVSGRKHEMTCPSNLLFNPKLLVCDWPINVDCTKDFCANKNPGNHPDPDTCSGFIMCDVAGRMHKMTCPGNLLFNSTLLVCDWPSNVDCDDGSGATAGF